jgi:ADP-heptose:LPS heptosyltransferase
MAVVITVPNGLGDAIHTLPAIESIYRNNKSKLVVIASKSVSIFFKKIIGINSRYILNDELKNYSPDLINAEILLDFNGLYNSFELDKINSNTKITHTTFSNPEIINGVKCILVNGIPVKSRFFNAIGFAPLPAWKLYTDMVEYAGFTNKINFSNKKNKKNNLNYAKHKKSIGITPCGVLDSKKWPINKYIYLANFLKNKGMEVNIYLGPNEKKYYKLLLLKCNEINIYYDLPLEELAICMKKNTLIISNDCGPMHVAGYLGIPLISIFNQTLPQCWFPYLNRHQICLGGYYCEIFKYPPITACWPTMHDVLLKITNLLKKL